MLPVAILAGGLATRLGDLTAQRPKSLVDVASKPFLAHQLELLRRNGVQRVVLCVGHLGEMIRDRFGDGADHGINLEYAFDGEVLLGTGGALRRALPQLGPEFFVLYGDSYLPIDYAAVEQSWRQSRRAGLMTVYRNEDALEPSNVEFLDGKIVAYDKIDRRPSMRHIDYGLGILSGDVLSAHPADVKFDLAKVYQELIQQRELAGMEVNQRFYEIGSRQGIADLDQYLRSQPSSH